MKITKFVHSCILVEDDEYVALFDPGQFSWESELFDISKLTRLDYLLITHEHYDHFYPEFVKTLVKKFPDVYIFSTQEVVKQLEDIGIKSRSDSDSNVNLQPLDHASMKPLNGGGPMCQNMQISYKNIITHPGDSINLTTTEDVLLLPLAGPWESLIEAVRKAQVLKPKVIVPIHDWMWNEAWRTIMYDRMEEFFAQNNIKFIKPVDGQSFEV